jgi:hypothetical protein
MYLVCLCVGEILHGRVARFPYPCHLEPEVFFQAHEKSVSVPGSLLRLFKSHLKNIDEELL